MLIEGNLSNIDLSNLVLSTSVFSFKAMIRNIDTSEYSLLLVVRI
jgi:hypothetical protein